MQNQLKRALFNIKSFRKKQYSEHTVRVHILPLQQKDCYGNK